MIATTESNPPNWLQRHRNFLTGALLMLTAWVWYLPTVNYGFVDYDDVRILRNHPELYGQKTFAADLQAIFVTSFPREEPLLLRDVSWALDSQVFGFGNAFGYHLGNVLLNGIVVALMFAFLLGTTRRFGLALAVTLAYLALAIHTEPVAWIMGRKDILSTLFMLLALCAQTRRLAVTNYRAQAGWYLATLIFLICGLFSKISVLTFPPVLFLHAIFLPYLNGERLPHETFQWGRGWLKEISLLVPGMMASLLVYHWYRQTLAQMGIFDRGYSAHGLAHFWNLLMINPLVIWIYVQQTFCPWHLQLLYVWPDLRMVYPAWQIAVSLASVTFAGVIGLWWLRYRKDCFFYFSTFFILMVPYLNLTYIGIWVAERYLFFPVFCLLVPACSLVAGISQRPSPILRMAALAMAVIFFVINVFQTIAYQPAWRNSETLWQYHVASPSANPTAYANLAAAYYAEATAHPGMPEMTLALNKMSVVVTAALHQFWPDQTQSPPPETYFLFFLQSLLQEVGGEPQAALASLLMADRLHPKFDSTNLNLSRLYHRLAGTTADLSLRQTYALAARDRFVEYLALVYRGRAASPADQKELAELEAAALVAEPPVGKSVIP